ncbi:hypothetical protein HYALB_00002834 [Hymenoscyphus albidus]|uniref:Ribosomal RNA methyltransferase FtsJ domain-containing protein n=1 Tax=Hymenoscyphus albidus TaxID=595503 RepID=A0A9N9LJJ3_9HELO|nr:hypothetical protein HYALB_00002834 [Hymenoscyphus albidus]
MSAETPKSHIGDVDQGLRTTLDELLAGFAEITLQDDPRDKQMSHGDKILKAYLFKNEPHFVNVMKYRDRGWVQNKEKGDAFFKAQREKADNTDKVGEKRFFVMMQQILDEMQGQTGFLNLPVRGEELHVFDICMAPGGYTAAVLKYYPTAKAFGVTLPEQDGGHAVLIPSEALAGLKYMDVTMLINEFGDGGSVPKTHPDYKKFIITRPFSYYKFDLVFCDGMVLRTQERATYREKSEVVRLIHSQLILAIQRIAPGGTLVMLLHKIDCFSSAFILYTLSTFAKVEVFKPLKKHNTRSSFYMIAKDVQPESEAAKAAVKKWKNRWWKATFGDGKDEDEPIHPKTETDESKLFEMIQEFGPSLMELGRPIWDVQAEALKRTEYAGDGSGPLSPSTDMPRSISIPARPPLSPSSIAPMSPSSTWPMSPMTPTTPFTPMMPLSKTASWGKGTNVDENVSPRSPRSPGFGRGFQRFSAGSYEGARWGPDK